MAIKAQVWIKKIHTKREFATTKRHTLRKGYLMKEQLGGIGWFTAVKLRTQGTINQQNLIGLVGSYAASPSVILT